MGRKKWNAKEVVENCHALSADGMTRDRVFSSPDGNRWMTWWDDAAGNEQFRIFYEVIRTENALKLRLSYGVSDDESFVTKKIEYDINVTATVPYFGGERRWFCCPAVHQGRRCNRRVGRLYLPPGQVYFACRFCYDLTYTSAQQHDARKDALLLDPATLIAALQSKNPKERSLGVGAFVQAAQRLRKHAR
jgi:hypothetical protein